MKHEHAWFYKHSVWEGRRGSKNEVGVVRYCGQCGFKQMAFTAAWTTPPKSYDLSEEGKT